MTSTEIRAQVLALAQAELRWQGDLPEGDLSAFLDSVQRLTLVVAIEDRFEISFGPEEDEQIRSLSDVVAAIAHKVQDGRERFSDAP